MRQSLFEFDDSKDGGKGKAETASAALKRIFPGVVSYVTIILLHVASLSGKAHVNEDVGILSAFHVVLAFRSPCKAHFWHWALQRLPVWSPSIMGISIVNLLK